ncbi:nucleoside-diphosphate-sugar epimerase [Litorivivens lipolytica]|uniref:Nucleoside-diphosphate-sugar epimerase n=1 Tax=Litorivivens lipolytica TaxID=1524264 RepID=A0A7W4W3X5_9GAMM|nr:SDR family NAD(P)-dependent oxidoreductase [Litorivivens lipolytica]MBB3047003.1 nucleoside-diphosphate-sugar epimerase [Litorivivens lipolytica]
MRILVTGATGFVGSHAALALREAGHDVRLLLRNPSKLEQILALHDIASTAPFTDIVVGDVTDAELVAKALKDCDGVIHTAAFVSTKKKDADKVISTNVGGTRNVIGQGCELGLKHLIHISSVAAIYAPDHPILTGEEPPAGSESAYGHSKAECERYVRGLQDAGYPVSILYPASIIGPHDPGLSEPMNALRIFCSRMGVVTSSGNQFVDVRDIATACVAIIEKIKQPERIPLGGHYYPWKELINTLYDLTGRRVPYAPIPGPLLRAMGVAGDGVVALTGADIPITSEGMQYATRWVRTDDSKYEQLLGLTFRDHRETLADSLRSLQRAGHIKQKHLGKLAL